jgi:hypothetical protein
MTNMPENFSDKVETHEINSHVVGSMTDAYHFYVEQLRPDSSPEIVADEAALSGRQLLQHQDPGRLVRQQRHLYSHRLK